MLHWTSDHCAFSHSSYSLPDRSKQLSSCVKKARLSNTDKEETNKEGEKKWK